MSTPRDTHNMALQSVEVQLAPITAFFYLLQASFFLLALKNRPVSQLFPPQLCCHLEVGAGLTQQAWVHAGGMSTDGRTPA